MTSEEYEKSDVPMKSLFMWAGGIVIGLALILIILNSMFTASKEQQVQDSVLKPESVELRDLRARETETLNSYKVIDEANGVVQIPIDRAMQLLAEEAFEENIKKVR